MLNRGGSEKLPLFYIMISQKIQPGEERLNMKKTISTSGLKILLLCLLSFVLIIGCKKVEEPEVTRQDTHSKKVIVRVDGTPVYEGDIIRRISAGHGDIDSLKANPDRWRRMFEAATETEILDELLVKEALSEGIEASQEDVDSSLKRTREMLGEDGFQQMLKNRDASEQEYREFLKERDLIKKYKAKLFENIDIDDETLQTYFEGHKQNFRVPDTVRLEIVDLDDDDAEAFYEKIKNNGELEQTVKEFSSEDRNLTFRRTKWIPYTAIPADIKELVESGKVGDIIRPAQVDREVQIIKILDKREAYTPAFEEVKDQLRSSILTNKQQKVLNDWYEKAKQKVNIEYVRQ
jgi:parvulin-like peptidyl-prolyl isomerase